MAAPVLRPLTTGEVLDVSFGLYRAMFTPLVIVTTVARLVPTVLGIYLTTSGGPFENPGLLVVQLVLSIVLNALGVAATNFIVAGAYLGHEITANAALRSARKVIGPLILLSLMTSLVIGVGFVLLIVPGVILLGGLLCVGGGDDVAFLVLGDGQQPVHVIHLLTGHAHRFGHGFVRVAAHVDVAHERSHRG